MSSNKGTKENEPNRTEKSKRNNTKYDGAFEEIESKDSSDEKNYSRRHGRSRDYTSAKNEGKSNNQDEKETGFIQNEDLEIIANRPYFFIFGMPNSGKSVMLSGLLYYLKTEVEGYLTVLNSFNKPNQKKGQFMMREMLKHVRSGRFVNATKPTDKTEFTLPNEIHLEFTPSDSKRPEMTFCLLDMAGEDQESVQFSDGGLTGGELDGPSRSYLEDKSCSLAFILAIDVEFPEKSEDLIDRFLNYIESLGHTENPILFVVNKWDTKRDKHKSVEAYFKKNFPLLNKRKENPKRFSVLLDFSIGDVFRDNSVDENQYVYVPKDSERLFNEWMCEAVKLFSAGKEIEESDLKRIGKWIKNFNND